MAKAHIHPCLPGHLKGTLLIPPSKSHTLRALLFALMAKGKSRIQNPLSSPDTSAMIDAICCLGGKVDRERDVLIVHGVAGRLKPAENVIDCGNSGQVLRFIGALSSLLSTYTIFTGDPSIRHNRLVQPLLDALQQLGAFAASSKLDGYAPIIIRGPLQGGAAILNGEDSQPISGLLILGAFTPLKLNVLHPGEQPWIALTLSWFDRLGIPYVNHNFERYEMKGGAKLDAFDYIVPGDFSSAAFPIGAALITHSELTLQSLDLKDSQGDKAILSVLEKMGARFEIDQNRLTVKKTARLKGIRIDINDFIDALPILAVIACFAEGTTEIVNAAIARKKESDRIRGVAVELRKMGASIEEKPDGLIIHGSPLNGAHLETYHDHRLVMALSVAALGAIGSSSVNGFEGCAKTWSTFLADFQTIGAHIERIV
ncbi:MAG: 3-phosphoshikimate 1-carboxyvinyltransferase [Chlamydiota bacterium]